MYIYILTWFSPRQHFLIPGFVMMHYFFFHQIEILHISSSLPLTLFSPADICSMTFTLYILSKRISWSWSCMDGICIQIGFALLFSSTYGPDHMFLLWQKIKWLTRRILGKKLLPRHFSFFQQFLSTSSSVLLEVTFFLLLLLLLLLFLPSMKFPYILH